MIAFHAIVVRLRNDGWAVRSIQEVAAGSVDPAVLASAVNHHSVLLTEDKDFGELVYRNRMSHCGVVLIRVDGLKRDSRVRVVGEAIAAYANRLQNSFTVISPGSVRIRNEIDKQD